MKTEQKQEFKSSGVLALLGLVSFSAAIIAVPWNKHTLDSKSEAAVQKATVVGYQVVQLYREAAQNTSKPTDPDLRGPASVEESLVLQGDHLRSTGTMGTDPWGQPYNYRILSSEGPDKVKILVWSGGPNKVKETLELEDEDKPLAVQPVYAGDDLGILLSVSHN